MSSWAEMRQQKPGLLLSKIYLSKKKMWPKMSKLLYFYVWNTTLQKDETVQKSQNRNLSEHQKMLPLCEWTRSGQSENSNKWDIETVVQMFKVCVVFLRQVKLLCAWANGCAFGGRETHTCFSLVRWKMHSAAYSIYVIIPSRPATSKFISR